MASPARYAAPEAVVSVLEGRITGGVQQVALEMHQQVVGAGAAIDAQRSLGRTQLGFPDRRGVMLNPAGFGIDLRELPLCHRLAKCVKNNRPRTGRPLVQREDVRLGSLHGTS